ncbi:zinc-finger domain of monoamine-oxidase A repressor R1 [Actinidia rufa]|uniref:Zinc-finger domain of monoamine-oxidase A repressor R1 n=1 Tax=Actinidia rufa TaxID=165716 RepID=A0A7J0E1T0_9ERIC|nr:zinc-finger domain of monoamine-oxidase A repressor R1 [Actinidia rufa]
MVPLRNIAQTLEAPANANNHQMDESGRTQTKETQTVSDYEQLREERIKENLERMQKLGIFDLSLKFKSMKPIRKNTIPKTPRSLSPLPCPGPVRRSSRLQNATPVSYFEVKFTKKDTALEGDCDLVGEGSKLEVYAEEHEKLLGNAQMSWTSFVDVMVMDRMEGESMIQSREKLVTNAGLAKNPWSSYPLQQMWHGSRTVLWRLFVYEVCIVNCEKYGEHVLEAKQNPDWICPVCRGICNCSLCRQAKGWPPTGALYRKISQLGFKSVAHYLIQTRRPETDSDKIPSTKVPASAKRSLQFSDTEGTLEGMKSPISNNDDSRLVTPKHEDSKTDDEFKDEKRKEMDVPENKHGAIDISSGSSQDHKKKSELTSESSDQYGELSKPESEDNKTSEILYSCTRSRPKSKRKYPRTPEPNTDNIAGRLRQRRHRGDGQGEELVGTNESSHVEQQESSHVEQQAVKDEPSQSEAKANTSQCSSINPGADSIAGRLRLRRK